MTQVSIYVDGGSRGNPGRAAAAFVVIEDGKIISKKGFFLGTKTNNEAEYSSVIYALKWLVERSESLDKVNVFLDSELVTKQLRGEYKMKSKNLMPLLAKARSLEKIIYSKIIYKNVPREKNRLADRMVNKVLDES